MYTCKMIIMNKIILLAACLKLSDVFLLYPMIILPFISLNVMMLMRVLCQVSELMEWIRRWWY